MNQASEAAASRSDASGNTNPPVEPLWDDSISANVEKAGTPAEEEPLSETQMPQFCRGAGCDQATCFSTMPNAKVGCIPNRLIA